MALTKEVKVDKIEIVGDYKHVQCRELTIVKEDGKQISRSVTRHVLEPSRCLIDEDGVVTHEDTDISGEPQETQDVCAVVWTDAVKAAWQKYEEDTRAGL